MDLIVEKTESGSHILIAEPDGLEYNEEDMTFETIKNFWTAVDIISISEGSDISNSVRNRLSTVNMKMVYNTTDLEKYEKRLVHTILSLENKPISEANCERVKSVYRVSDMLQLITFLVYSLEYNNMEIPSEYLSQTAKVNSRLYNLNGYNYNIFSQALLFTNHEFLRTERKIYVPFYVQEGFNSFVSSIFTYLAEKAEDPLLEMPMIPMMAAKKEEMEVEGRNDRDRVCDFSVNKMSERSMSKEDRISENVSVVSQYSLHKGSDSTASSSIQSREPLRRKFSIRSFLGPRKSTDTNSSFYSARTSSTMFTARSNVQSLIKEMVTLPSLRAPPAQSKEERIRKELARREKYKRFESVAVMQRTSITHNEEDCVLM